MKTILIYGATGYMGALAARRCQEAGLSPILAGRDQRRLDPVAAELDLPTRVFALADAEPNLSDVDVLLNAAGPFGDTAPPLLAACLAAGTHYVDFAGEVPEFQAVERHGAAAERSGVMVMPGVGFGVVATDLAAANVAGKITNPSTVELAFRTVGGVSRGTAGVLLPGLHRPGVTYRDGELTPARPAQSTVHIDFGDGRRRPAVLNPWRADLVTAPISTGARTVTTYQHLPAPIRLLMRTGPRLRPLLDSAAWQAMVRASIRRLPAGPTDAQLAAGSMQVWARASNDAGDTATVRLDGPEAYEFTARAARAILTRIIEGQAPIGFQTPTTAYGTKLLADLPGTTLTDL
jgi:short subunit dehydrogenase-like uncharacterized protein